MCHSLFMYLYFIHLSTIHPSISLLFSFHAMRFDRLVDRMARLEEVEAMLNQSLDAVRKEATTARIEGWIHAMNISLSL